ncbi:unnamed protein product [Rotaria magnacalcarata]
MLAIGNTAATPLAVTAVNGGLRRRYGCIRCSVWSFLVDDTAVYGWTRLLNGGCALPYTTRRYTAHTKTLKYGLLLHIKTKWNSMIELQKIFRRNQCLKYVN